ncbi:MAG: glycogen-debranching protein [Acidobacteriia bacterium]|nr:glycogen-debranching protein [Terriglobia bacterium]
MAAVSSPRIAHAIEKGSPHPLGATPGPEGVNFSLFTENATGVDLLLFEAHDSPAPYQTIRFDPFVNKTFHFWHAFVRGLQAGTHYAYRVDGPWDPAAGHRFNRNKVLIDPYARGNTESVWNRAAACGPEDNAATSMRSIVIDPSAYDWEGDRPLARPMEDTVIYEMHVRGFTRSPSSSVEHPGTFAGVIEKVPHLKDLGVTAVELLPVFDFDENSALRESDGRKLTNYWGYSLNSFFAPQSGYCVSPESGSHLREFRDMVKALHRAGIEVILDVVFNHTDEGNQLGPTFSFRGIDNRVYYFLVPWDLVECLRYWVREAHVDGFRFDEGSILARDENGCPCPHPPVVWQIELDEELADTKVIAEAWDAAGLYQIGHFPGDRWAEWNGRYRDDIRRFVRGDPGVVGNVASRLAGSADIYQQHGQLPVNSINFVTCHDGFTMNDLVSYDEKHNQANGEDNRDGINENLSWNCGSEGASDDPAVEALRERLIRNFAAILMLSRGVPMMLGGDEMRRTQRGNNNPYCQDNEISWYDWTLAEKNQGLHRFWKFMIEFRKRHAALRRGQFFSGAVNGRGLPAVAWHGTKLNSPGWTDPDARALGMTLAGFDGDPDIHVMMNMHWDALEFELPAISGREWRKAVDTAEQRPRDIGGETPVEGETCTVQARSVVVLVNG